MPQIALISWVNVQRVALLLSLAYSSGWAGQGVECPPGCSPGRWSSEAVDLSSVRSKAPYETRDIRVPSPDRQKIAHIVKDKWWIEIGGEKISPGPKDSSILYPAELAWAPDSRAFFITESSSYSTGFQILIYRIENDKLRYIGSVNQIVQSDFERRHKCSEGQRSNIAGLSWQDDSQHLLVVAEVPPVGICEHIGYFGGYLISVTAHQIVERYSPDAIANRWKDALGYRLKGDYEHLPVEQRAMLP